MGWASHIDDVVRNSNSAHTSGMYKIYSDQSSENARPIKLPRHFAEKTRCMEEDRNLSCTNPTAVQDFPFFLHLAGVSKRSSQYIHSQCTFLMSMSFV